MLRCTTLRHREGRHTHRQTDNDRQKGRCLLLLFVWFNGFHPSLSTTSAPNTPHQGGHRKRYCRLNTHSSLSCFLRIPVSSNPRPLPSTPRESVPRPPHLSSAPLPQHSSRQGRSAQADNRGRSPAFGPIEIMPPGSMSSCPHFVGLSREPTEANHFKKFAATTTRKLRQSLDWCPPVLLLPAPRVRCCSTRENL